MEILARFDEKNYSHTTKVLERFSVRAIILQNGKLAMQCSKDGEYKIPGGGQEQGETYTETLLREVREETGLLIKENSIREIGEIVEIRKDIFDENQKYICHSLFYYCEVKDETVPVQLTESEIKKGYVLKWAAPEEIYNRNILIEKDSWIVRDTAFVKMYMDGKIRL